MKAERLIRSSKAGTKANTARGCGTALMVVGILTCLPGTRALAQLNVQGATVEAARVDGSNLAPAKVDFTLRSLPDAPLSKESVSTTSDGASLPEQTAQEPVAPIYIKYIMPGVIAQRITAHDKVIIGLRDLYTPFAFAGFFASAGYSHVLNGQPNYGTDRGAFGERLGAAALDGTTQGIFVDTIFSPLLREDPRYYGEGPKFSILHRTVYAGTRVLVTRTDSGHHSVNGALLLGYAAATALTASYYPQSNRNFHDSIATFGGSVGGEALDFVFREFASDVLQKLHLVRRQ